MSSEAKISAALVRGLNELGCHVYKANDARSVGIPDIVGVGQSGKHIAIETKFVKAWPSRGTARLLQTHDLTAPQSEHLEHVWERHGYAAVAIGFPIPVPFQWDWNEEVGEELRGKWGCTLIGWPFWRQFGDTSSGWPRNMDFATFQRVLRNDSMVCHGSMSASLVPWDWGNL